jgi:hypothetical protein
VKLVWSDLERRAVAISIIGKLTHVAPSPWDMAALAVELAEMANESIGHCCDRQPHLGTREELQSELERVRAVARESSQSTTAARMAQIAAGGSGVPS